MKEIFWIEDPSLPASSGRIAIVLRPRGDDWLEDEIGRIKRGGVDLLVSMLEDQEANSLGLALEGKVTNAAGLTFQNFPIRDRTTPLNLPEFGRLVQGIVQAMQSGRSVGVHCRGSIGRSTIVAACVLIQLGWDARAALTAIEAARECPVPDTEEQRAWILKYQAEG